MNGFYLSVCTQRLQRQYPFSTMSYLHRTTSKVPWRVPLTQKPWKEPGLNNVATETSVSIHVTVPHDVTDANTPALDIFLFITKKKTSKKMWTFPPCLCLSQMSLGPEKFLEAVDNNDLHFEWSYLLLVHEATNCIYWLLSPCSSILNGIMLFFWCTQRIKSPEHWMLVFLFALYVQTFHLIL